MAGKLINKGLLMRMGQDSEGKACSPSEDPQLAQSELSPAKEETLVSEGVQPGSPLASGTDQVS